VTEPQPSLGARVAPIDDGVAALHHPRVWYRLRIVGFGTTASTDTFQEQNGLLTMDRRPKADLDALARATRGEGDALT
jgi:hypothetical protein